MSTASFLDLWDCNTCSPCGYDQKNVDGNCESCPADNRVLHHKIPVLTTLETCDVASGQFVCEEGYHFSDEYNKCVPCIVHQQSNCPSGEYFERCQKTDTWTCNPCMNPIPNMTSQTYGSYSMVPSCSASAPLEIIEGRANCAIFMTPLWDDYQCSIECKTNFIDIKQDSGSPPECVPCYEKCSPGETCYGGSFKTCQPCDGTLESNMMWLPDTSIYDPPCRSACAYGFYYNARGECTHCLQNQKCFKDSEIFLGCTGTNPGQCQAKTKECVEHETFLSYEVYSTAAECRKCSQPMLGTTFIFSNCTTMKDTVLHACQSVCPTGHYKVKNCSLLMDSVCTKCTDPRTVSGMLLSGLCGGESDYTFSVCPEGYACDGTKREAYTCIWPMTAKSGVCRCPHGTYLQGDKCSVIVCASGQYPHTDTGKCIPCTTQTPNHTITIDNVWGKEACACEEGYFIERIEEGEQPINCWPCGDLACKEGIQYQSPCPGVLTDHPECLCSLPSGVKASSDGKCLFSSCEDDLDKTNSVFETMAENAPKLWESSFWVSSSENVKNVTVHPSSMITSMIVINHTTMIYVLNYTTLWLTNLDNKATGMINKDLFIFGYRNMTNNVLLEITVCKDTAVNRFWISFAMLTTTCGNLDRSDVEEVFLCSNIELIQLNTIELPNSCSSSTTNLCVNIPETGLYAENMFSIWGGENIGSGIPSIKITFMTIHYNLLYMVMDSNKVYTYEINYYDPDVPLDQRRENTVTTFPVTNANINDIITCMLFVDDKLFALVNGYLCALLPNQGGLRLLGKMGGIKLIHLQQGPRQGILLGIAGKTDNYIYEMDVWNGMVLTRITHLSKLYIFTDSQTFITVSQQNVVQISKISSVCPLDHQSYFQGVCTIQPCLSLKDACGINGIRAIGSTICTCSAGYYMDGITNQCQICKVKYYCTGLSTPQACPENSVSETGSSSITQCLCNAGYYKFKQNLCLPCPKGYWCYGGQTTPIQCTSGAFTLLSGAQSPVECQCKVRTQGIDCQPCASTDVCILMSSDQLPMVSAIHLYGSGSVNSDFILNKTCLQWGVSIVYTLPWTITMQQEKNKNNAKGWAWMIVSEPLPTTGNDELLLSNISDCMSNHGFTIYGAAVYTRLKKTSNVQTATPCGLNSEWSGDLKAAIQCTCIAGYDKSTFSSNICTPCPKETIRSRLSSEHCVPCKDNNSHAPWLGMEHCICKDGYYMDFNTHLCEPVLLGIDSTFSSMWLVIPLSLFFCLVCILGVWFVSFLSIN